MAAKGGFTFYTNAKAAKEEIRANDQQLLFHWKSLRRQIRIEGTLTEVDPETATAYFHSRSRDCSWVRSRLTSPARWKNAGLPRPVRAGEAAIRWQRSKAPLARTVTLAPQAIEFWLDQPNHFDRRVFTRGRRLDRHAALPLWGLRDRIRPTGPQPAGAQRRDGIDHGGGHSGRPNCGPVSRRIRSPCSAAGRQLGPLSPAS